MNSPDIELTTTLLVRRFTSGASLCAPVTALHLGAYGPEGHSLAEARMFLSEHLSRVTPEQVARFGLPDGIKLQFTDVVVPRESFTRRLQIRTAMTVPSVVIPNGDDAWVIVVPLRHTFYVRKDEKLDEAIRAEVIRLAGASEFSAYEYLGLLPANDHALETVTVSIERVERLPAEKRASLRKTLAARQRQKWAIEVLESVSLPMHQGLPRIPPLVARDHELKQLTGLLDGTQRLSVLLQGPSLSGKSALVRQWLRARRDRDPNARVYLTSGAQLIAGMSGLGQWEERVRRVMEAAEVLDAVLAFDNLGDILGDRTDATHGGGVDIPNAMKSWIEEGRVRVVGELRTELVDAAERTHAGFLGCFSKLKLDALDAKLSLDALRQRILFERKHQPHRTRLSPEAAPTLIDLCERYLPYQAFPGKAMRLYDDLRAVHESDHGAKGEAVELGSDAVHEMFSVRSGIPAFLLREDRALRLDDVVNDLAKRVVGQTEAVRRVAETVCVVKAQLQPQGKPLATLLFVGPTGVGKTELARALAVLLFGRDERMVRFDMSEFTDGEAADRLIRGSGRAEGLLTRKVREQPFCVLLLDEIEKAHPAVFDLLLQVCGEGRLTDGLGRTAYFHNAIIIMTSNLGAVAAARPAAGFSQTAESAEKFYAREVDKTFRPEFVNRLDRIVAFHPLSADEVLLVARIAMDRILARRGLAQAGVRMQVSERALDALVKGGYSARYGARALRRHLEDHLVVPVAALLSGVGTDAQPDDLHVTTEDEEGVFKPSEGAVQAMERVHQGLRFTLFRAKGAERARDQRGLGFISARRRTVDQLMGLVRVEEVKGQIEYLTTQLNYGSDDARRDKRNALEMAELQGEHHRLTAVWEKLEGAAEQIRDLEEVGLMSLFEKGGIDDLIEESAQALGRFRAALAHALVATEPRRDQVTLLCTELDTMRAFDHWLAELLEDAPARGWRVETHIDAGERDPEIEWPTHRRWGPPRSAEWMRAKLAEEPRGFQNVLVRVSGTDAGVLLALEAGLHRYLPSATSAHAAQMYVRLLAMTTQLKDHDWDHPIAAPDSGNKLEERRHQSPTRVVALQGEKITVPSRNTISLKGTRYFSEIEQVALEHLLPYEDDDAPDRTELFSAPLDMPHEVR